jgi:EmrB/QacA subfamily drug resistance transporter
MTVLASSPPTAPRAMLTPLIVACALFMEHLDSTVLSTALPAIARDFAVDPTQLSLAITGYLFSLAVFIPASGWVADRFGTRQVFRAAILVFTLGSVLCGFAGSPAELVLARVLQGIGGAMMVPVGRLVVLRATPKPDLIRAMAYLTVPALIGPVIGPPLGGFIVTYGSWRWIFFLNLPIALVGYLLVSRFIADGREATVPPFDWGGLALTGFGFGCLVFGMETIGRDAVPGALAAGSIAAGVVLTWLYIHYARGHADPLMDLSLLTIPTFRASILGGTLFRIGVGALPFLLPLMLQIGFGLSALQSGMLTFAAAAGALLMKLVGPPILRALGFRRVLVANAVISALFMAGYGLFTPATPHLLILVTLLLGGFFRSLQFTAVNTIAYADIPSARMSAATSLSSTMQQLSLTVGVATGALAVELTRLAQGGAPLGADDFLPAFLVVGAALLLSGVVFIRLPRDAGGEISGHRPGHDDGA